MNASALMEAIPIKIHLTNVQAIATLENILPISVTVSKNAALSDHTMTSFLASVFVNKEKDVHRLPVCLVHQVRSPIRLTLVAEQSAVQQIKSMTSICRTVDVATVISLLQTAPVKTTVILDTSMFLAFLISFAVSTALHTTLASRFVNVPMGVSHHKADLVLSVRPT
jgi:hypothetical protein